MALLLQGHECASCADRPQPDVEVEPDAGTAGRRARWRRPSSGTRRAVPFPASLRAHPRRARRLRGAGRADRRTHRWL